MIHYPVIPIDPGPLQDGDLQLVAPSHDRIDELMPSLRHPETYRQMYSVSQTTREQVFDFVSRLKNGYDPGGWDEQIVPAYHFWMLQSEEPKIVGGINLRIGEGPNIDRVIGHVGYHVYPFARGHRYAERACRLLLPLARHHGVDPLWITCNPDNIPSRKTIERLGGVLTQTLPIPMDHPLRARGETEKCIYRLDN